MKENLEDKVYFSIRSKCRTLLQSDALGEAATISLPFPTTLLRCRSQDTLWRKILKIHSVF